MEQLLWSLLFEKPLEKKKIAKNSHQLLRYGCSHFLKRVRYRCRTPIQNF